MAEITFAIKSGPLNVTKTYQSTDEDVAALMQYAAIIHAPLARQLTRTERWPGGAEPLTDVHLIEAMFEDVIRRWIGQHQQVMAKLPPQMAWKRQD